MAYSNIAELRAELEKLNLQMNPFSDEFIEKLKTTPTSIMFAHWLSHQGRENQFILYPEEFRILVNALIIVSRSFVHAINSDVFDKIVINSDERLSSPEFYVPSLENPGVDYYSVEATQEGVKCMIDDILSSELDAALTDDDSFGIYYTHFGTTKEGMQGSIQYDIMLSDFVINCASDLSPASIGLGALIYTYVHATLITAVNNDISLLQSDKYIVTSECYKISSKQPFEPLIALISKIKNSNHQNGK